MAHETFGPYLLLKKLSEDSLGEVYRAGRLREGNLEQVVLLRVFNGRSLDADTVARGIQQRAGVQPLLRSPNLAQGLEAGEFEGVPFVVYDYISGRDLATLMNQASLRSHPVPTEHALLIAERLALGLSVAHGTKFDSGKILHGFMVPPLVMLSNEGENKILGFEVSTALRDSMSASELGSEFARYLSPETHSGEPLHPTDDVYSLGVILLELLVGHSVENLGPSSLKGAIGQVSGRGLPNVAALIEQSIAPRDQRIESTAAWHEQLNRLVLDRQSSSTPFHLAFYMHNLFRDEIELETQEIEQEKSIDFSEQFSAPPTPFAQAAAGASGSDISLPGLEESAPALETSAPSLSQPDLRHETGPAKSSGGAGRGLLIAAVVLALVGVGSFFAWRQVSGGSGTEPKAGDRSVRAATSPTTDPSGESGAAGGEAPADGSQPAGGNLVEDARSIAEGVESDSIDPGAAEREADRERMMAELNRLVEERTQAAAQGIKQEYDEEVARLRKQLEEAEKERLAEEKKAQEEAERKRLAAAEEERKRLEQQKLEEERKLAEAEAAQADPNQDPAAPSSQAGAPSTAAQGGQGAASTSPERTVRVGELVRPGPGVVRPRLTTDVRPVYPFAAQRLRREAELEVEVLVDENGNVVDTRLDKKAGFGFDDAARSAAAKAKFAPATKQGVKVKMWTTIRVNFRLDGS